jgi:hypothetical protein
MMKYQRKGIAVALPFREYIVPSSAASFALVSRFGCLWTLSSNDEANAIVPSNVG